MTEAERAAAAMLELPDIALSVRQPWAWAIVQDLKDIENRTAIAIRNGIKPARIAIHASKGMTRGEYWHAANFMKALGIECPPPADLPRGGIVGAVTVAGIVNKSDSKWFFGPRGLVLKHAKPCPFIPALGALGYFAWRPSGGEGEAPAQWMLESERELL